MPRLRHRLTGVVVTVSDALAGRLVGYEPLGEAGEAQPAPAEPDDEAQADAEAPAEGGGEEPGDDEETGEEEDDDTSGPYSGWTVATIEAEIRRRNEGRDRDDRIPATGNKADLIAALRADDVR